MTERRRRLPTFVVWFQLGEFRLFSVGEISDSGRGSPADILEGDLEMRRGSTWGFGLATARWFHAAGRGGPTESDMFAGQQLLSAVNSTRR